MINTLFEVVHPARFQSQVECDDVLFAINAALAFDGIRIYFEDGKRKICSIDKADTVTQAQNRADVLRSLIEQRNLHAEMIRFCKPELLDRNYFHAILESTKSILSRLRRLTGLEYDGAKLVQTVFSTSNPYLKLNNLKTESEISEQSGFSNLIIGVTSMFRNPTAHTPKIEREIHLNEAIEIFTIVSFVHQKLDKCSKVQH